MKKLFLFISMLFIFSAVCSANAVPLEQCSNGSWMPPGQCPGYNTNNSLKTTTNPPIYILLIEPDTNKYELIDLNTTESHGINYALSYCDQYQNSTKVVCSVTRYDTMVAVVSSEDGRLFKGGKYAGMGKNTAGYAKNQSINECKKAKGKNCKLILIITNLKLTDKRDNSEIYLKTTKSWDVSSYK